VEADSKINLQTWYLTENGCYANVPPVILDYLEDQGFSAAWVESAYALFIAKSRAAFFLNYEVTINSIEYSHKTRKDSAEHPLRTLCDSLGLSRQGLAKELCVQPSVLYKLESGKQKAVPNQLETALLEVGMTSDNLQVFQKKVSEWHR